MTKRYKEAREDYEFLVKHHGADVNDLTGGFVLEDHCFELLKNPTKTRAARLYEDMIIHSYTVGFEGLGLRCIPADLYDERVVEIYERYGCM